MRCTRTSTARAAGRRRASSAIGSDLLGPFDRPPGDPKGPGGWWLPDDPELRLGDDVLVPAVAGWRRETMPVLPNVAGFRQAPQWVLEVVSPGTARIDRVRELSIYAREGVGRAWLVDPLARTLEVYRLEAGRWLLAATRGGDDVVRAEPFDAIELDPARWWMPEDEAPAAWGAPAVRGAGSPSTRTCSSMRIARRCRSTASLVGSHAQRTG